VQFRSCDCRRLERTDVDWWDDPSPEGSFYWSRETELGVTYRTLWIRMPYDAGERQHSWHCIPVHREGEPRIDMRRAQWEWDGDPDKPTLRPSIRYGGPENNWHGYLTAGRLEACE